jgi:histone deacetylase 1/2
MAEDTSPPSTPVTNAGDNVLRPPPLTAFREDDDSFRSNLTFSLKISEKLTEKNFHVWRQQVEPYINAHYLDDFLVSPEIPPRFLTAADHLTGTLNPVYRKWRQKDQMLMSWLQTTLSSEILARVLGSNHTFELWNKIQSYFQKQMRAKARQLRVELRSTKLEDRSIQEYLLRIRLLIDNLVAIGDPVPLNHHLDVILEGLPPDFNSVISVIESRFETMDLDEAEALLLAHEARLDKSKKKTLDDAASLNLAQASSSKSTPNSNSDSVSTNPSVNSTTGPDSSYSPSNRGRGGRNGRGRGRNGGGGRYSNVQCQICFKTGDPAFECWHRSNLQYQPPMNAQHHAGYGAYQANYGQNLGGYCAMQPPAFNYNGYGTNFGAPQPNFNPYQPHFAPPTRPCTSQVAPPNALLTNTPYVSGSGTWYPDSGASFHVTADARNIQEPSLFDGADQVFIGNGQGLPIHSFGFGVFPSPILPNIQLSLNNLVFIRFCYGSLKIYMVSV